MSKTILVSLLTTFLLASVLNSEAQQPANIPRVGFLRAVEAEESYAEAFRQELKKLGYVEGKNIALEYRSGRNDQLPKLAAELVGLQVAIIVADGTSRRPGCQARNQQDPDCYDDQYRSCGDRAHC